MLTTNVQKRYCTIYSFEQKHHFFYKIVLARSKKVKLYIQQ